ncbi:efflux RND transporter permease subunit [Sandaracinobacteroides saxicola]|uniref:Efflux RND transporter permease subunit n=1 Tax=Sandaracinobacteroides saxicola TaxID=2759707 RepID=A0A7G5IIV7_9SPHN|nr:efflux RND transporter permease subunit [Sandaracinobacteroides saxicola]QMW23299.1 efflux RND transporter permease subunit [Sandaracinobacteroides saxicola]
MRNISAWSIKNPVAPLVAFAMLTLAGLVSFFTMDINNNPDIDFPAAQVVVVQPGAAPTELETQVTQRVEAALRSINGVDEISSYVSEGNSRTFVQFAIGTPVDRGVNDVRDAIANIRSDLPQGILQPQVTRVDAASGGPIAYISAEAVDMTLEELSWYVDNTVAKKLLSVSGMAAVRRDGGVNREIRVILDPARMQAYGITAAQVNGQLRQVNLNAARGRTEIAGSEQAVRVLGNARNADDLAATQISLGNGRTIYLRDIATVRDLYAEQRSISKMDGRQVLSFSLEKSKGSSDVAVYDAAQKVLAELQKDNPKVRFKQLFTTVDYTKEQYDSALMAMIEGAVLAVIVVFLFLRDWRATVISALAIPLSAIPTFWFMDLMGFSLNSLSLLALSLVAGVLVDDAIVEIENIVRHMRMGKSAYQAAMDAADEIGLAVVATTFSIVAVFLPVGLMPGISGQFFKNFGFTVVFAVLLSLAVARLITPMLAAYFLSAKGEAAHGDSRWVHWYMDLLRWSLKNRWKTVGIGALALVATVFSFATLPLTFQPNIDTDYSQIRIQMPPGSTLAQNAAVADKVTAIVKTSPAVEYSFAEINIGNSNIYLTLRKDRPMSSVEFERSMAPKLAAIPDARVNFQSQTGGGIGRDMTVMLAGNDPVQLEAVASKIVDEMRGLKELRQPRIEGDVRRPEITIKPRFDLAAELGVTTAALSETIRIATLGDIDQNVAKFSLSDRQIPIRVALSEESRQTITTLENLPVPTTRGGTVPLKVVADLSFGAGPTELRRFNQQRRVVVGADLAPGLVSGDAQPKIDALPTMKNLPQGVEKVQFGQDKWQAELLVNFIIAVIAGVLLVFAVLVLLYKRVLPPFVNMGSLLLAPLGGAIALHLTGNAISMPVFIGLLMLLGIVAKNSILLVDMAIEEMHHGAEKLAAILEAGHKRVQPIVMTTVAMVAGMLPIALSLSGDGSWRAPMGIVVIGGLIMSTALTLLIVPAGFSLAVSAETWLAPRLMRWFTNGERAPKPKPTPVAGPAE